MPLRPDAALIARFRQSLAALGVDVDTVRLGVAVSGGPDSVALLLLAAAALPGRVAAATVDHGFRAASAGEAAEVGALCAHLGVPHAILTLDWTAPTANRQAEARTARYAALADWAAAQGVDAVATAHHADDQAETVLMRLHRGAGVGGLAGIRPRRALRAGGHEILLLRPLLDWRRATLAAIPADLGAATVSDPANDDPAHDRTGARRFLDASPAWPDRLRLAASAHHLREAEEAIAWSVARLAEERVRAEGEGQSLDTQGLPAELRRRLVQWLIVAVGGGAPRGDRLERALRLLDAGRTVTLAGVVVRARTGRWHFTPAPPRRRA